MEKIRENGIDVIDCIFEKTFSRFSLHDLDILSDLLPGVVSGKYEHATTGNMLVMRDCDSIKICRILAETRTNENK